jgi:hypothetical protein
MPLLRDLYWIETVVTNIMESLGAIVSRPFRDTTFEYWLLEREGQNKTFFFSLLLGSIVWFILLDCSIRRQSKLIALEPSPRMAEVDVDPTATQTVQPPAPSFHNEVVPTPPTSKNPFLKKLAPPGHRPTNAHLNISPFHLARNLGKPPVLNASNPFATPPQGRNSGVFDANRVPFRFGPSPEVGDE